MVLRLARLEILDDEKLNTNKAAKKASACRGSLAVSPSRCLLLAQPVGCYDWLG
jgi:hypothetical protein